MIQFNQIEKQVWRGKKWEEKEGQEKREMFLCLFESFLGKNK